MSPCHVAGELRAIFFAGPKQDTSDGNEAHEANLFEAVSSESTLDI